MTELLSPAGGREALVAAVQNGADAVYMGFGSFNARRSARNFSEPDQPGQGPGGGQPRQRRSSV